MGRHWTRTNSARIGLPLLDNASYHTRGPPSHFSLFINTLVPTRRLLQSQSGSCVLRDHGARY
eukprot:11863672-Prorocentrum_lima.AAC.1